MTVISFARGAPSPDFFAVDELADCTRAAFERDGRTILAYGHAAGYPPFRDWLGARHGVEPGRVLVTNSSLQGFVFFAQLCLARRPGRVLVEAPTYDRPLKILAGLGAEVATVPVDGDGLDVDALERELRSGSATSFLYTIPTFQNPSGRTLTAERRHRLVELARDHDLLVLEDDPYGAVRFEGEPQPTLLELEGGERVAYSSSFSKTIAPGLRVGYLVAPSELAAPLEAIAVSTYITPVLPAQATVLEFLVRGLYEPNLARICTLLRERRDAMLDALARELPEGARWSRPLGGYFVWLDLWAEVDTAALLERADAAGVTFVKGADFYPGGDGGRSSARLAFSYPSPAEIDEGVTRLAALLPVPSAA